MNKDYCGFCRRHKKEVARLIDGPTVAICNDCIELLREMLAETGHVKPPETAAAAHMPIASNSRSNSSGTALKRMG